MVSSEEEPVAWLRAAILERKAIAEAATCAPWEAEGDDPTDDEVWIGLDDDSAIRLVILRGPESHENMLHVAANDPRDVIARCEAELAIMKAHHILHRDDHSEEWAEFGVTPHPGASGCDFGCVTCHYRGMGSVWGQGYCYTVRALAQGYRHWPGFPAAFALIFGSKPSGRPH